MATTTENYGLTKPAETDFFNVDDMNENMDTIDGALAAQAAETAAIGETLTEMDGKIGTAADTGTDTLFGLMKQGGSLIKSIQRVTIEPENGVTDAPIAIQPVDPARSLVILEELKNHTNFGTVSMDYTLHEDHISFTMSSFGAGDVKIGFWVVEFY